MEDLSRWFIFPFRVFFATSLNRPIDYFRIPHNTLCLPPQFCITYCLKCSWENAILPGAFKNNGLCKIWGANRVYYGKFENRECTGFLDSGIREIFRLRVVPIFPQGYSERNASARENHPTRERRHAAIFLSHRHVSPFSRGMIFTSARVSLALLSLTKNGDYS